MNHEAIYNTHPSVVTIRGDNAFDADDNPVTLDQVAVDAETARLQAEHNAQAYARNRASAYAPIADQLDMQYWDSVNGTTTWEDHVASIKNKFPKV